jgi:hypothetical protein
LGLATHSLILWFFKNLHTPPQSPPPPPPTSMLDGKDVAHWHKISLGLGYIFGLGMFRRQDP